ncbi:TolC family outer membrane protein [Facilibium subflavum]|uniref:TolC family outer membrane protein n=1 Tax=Facilibium subflavum TaxID=2219058 RepID=UPI0013C313D0|nr:TolC family outer membrane protein [Facilibium subflavum]
MKKLLIVLGGLAVSLNVYAQQQNQNSSGDQVAKNLSQIYQMAKQNNASYKAAEAQLSSDNENVPIALGKLLPTVDLGYTAKRSYSSAAVSSGARKNYLSQSPSISASQVLFNWGSWGGYSAAVYQAKADAITFAQAQQNLILSVAQAYFNILQQQDNVVYAKANQSWNKELLNQIEEKYKVGLSAITDVQASKAQYEQSVAETVQAENALATAYASLAQITGEQINAIENLRNDFPFDKPQPADMKKWLDIALKQNLNIVQNQYLFEAAKEGVSGYFGAFLPSATLNAQASRALSYQNQNYTSGTNTAEADVTVSWNVLNGGADYATLKQQKYTTDAAKYTLLQSQRNTTSSLKTSYLNVLSDISQVAAYKQAVIAAQASVEAMKAGYEVGTRTIVDLLNQQQQLFNAQEQYAQAKYAYINDLLTLKQNAGTLSYQDIDKINQWLTAKKQPTMLVNGTGDQSKSKPSSTQTSQVEQKAQ